MIERTWEDKPAILIASGPSLEKHYIPAGAILAGCNDAYKMYPNLDLLYAADVKWWRKNYHLIKKLNIPELCVPNERYAEETGITHIKGKGARALSTDPNQIHFASNSGFQLFNIAFLKGANPIILLGYDCTYDGDKAHWFGSHQPELRDPPKEMNRWAEAYNRSLPILEKHGIKVYNCSSISAIKAFPKMEYKECINLVKFPNNEETLVTHSCKKSVMKV